MKKCLYCGKELEGGYLSNKAGNFCSTEHFDKYLQLLSNEEYIELQHSFCICSDDGDE